MADVLLRRFVDATVNRGTRPIDIASFDTPMFLGNVNFFNTGQRVRAYGDTDAMVADGFPANHPAVVYATKVFSQPRRPTRLLVGQRTYDNYVVTPTVTDTAVYTLRVGVSGSVKTYTFTSDASATATEIVDGLESLINADSDVNTAVTAANSSDTLTLTPASGEEVFVQLTTTNLALTVANEEDVATALAAVAGENDNWYFLGGQTRNVTEQTALSTYAGANGKLYITSESVTTAGDPANTTGIAAVAMAAQTDRTHVVAVQANQLDEYVEGGVTGARANSNPGTGVLHAITLVNTPTSVFSETQRLAVEAKNANYYPIVAGVGAYYNGSQASGVFFDDVRHADWLEARIEESVFTLQSQKANAGLKIPHSNPGYQMVRQAIFTDVINVGIRRGTILTEQDGATDPQVTIPDRSAIPANDIANRVLNDVVVDIVYSGAVQSVRIQVYVTV